MVGLKLRTTATGSLLGGKGTYRLFLSYKLGLSQFKQKEKVPYLGTLARFDTKMGRIRPICRDSTLLGSTYIIFLREIVPQKYGGL